MTRTLSSPKWIAALALAGLTGVASATLPAPSPAAAQAAAAKKAAADAQAAKDKQELLASEDAVASRWRSRGGRRRACSRAVVRHRQRAGRPARRQTGPGGAGRAHQE